MGSGSSLHSTAFTHFAGGVRDVLIHQNFGVEERFDGSCARAVWRPPSGKKGIWLLDRLVGVGGHGLRVRRLGGTRAGEIGLTRFLRNPAVTVEAMVAEASRRTAERCAGRRVLVIQDTTVVRAAARRGQGLFLHAALVVDADEGAVLGLADARFLLRDGSESKSSTRHAAFEDKESVRWLRGVQAADRVGAAAERVTVIADRESDVFEVFAQRPQGVDLLIRAKHDRAMGDGGERLWVRADAAPEAGRAQVDLPPRPGRRARTATVAVRKLAIEPARPGRGGQGKHAPGGVRLTLVDVREVDPPAGVEPLHWRLLTTLPTGDAAEAFAIVDLYRRRWAIEQLFRTLKTAGFDIAAVEIADDAARRRLVMAALVAAVTVQQLVHARDGTQGPSPLRPLTDAFEASDLPLLKAFTAKLEGKTQRQKNPHPEGSLAHASWVCARLGGWTGYYGKPGPAVMLSGWLHFQAAKDGVSTLANNNV